MSGIFNEEDSSLNLLSQCVLLSLEQKTFDFTGLDHYILHFETIDCFGPFLISIASNLILIVERFQNRSFQMSTQRYPKINQWLEAIIELNDFWKLNSWSTKVLLLKHLHQQSQVLDVLHALAMRIFLGMFSYTQIITP